MLGHSAACFFMQLMWLFDFGDLRKNELIYCFSTIFTKHTYGTVSGGKYDCEFESHSGKRKKYTEIKQNNSSHLKSYIVKDKK